MQTLLVELDEEDFEGLVALANRHGTSPARLVSEWLAKEMNVSQVVTTSAQGQAENQHVAAD